MGSFPTPSKSFSSLPETSCGYLLQELKLIWDEVGQEKNERQKVLLELEQECLEIYKRKVDKANVSRSRLHQLLADSEAELTHLLVCLGERSLPRRPEKVTGTLKEQLDSITPALQEIKLRKEERVKQFLGIQMQIQRIQAEIAGESEIEISTSDVKVHENDLSLKKVEEYQVELQQLQKNKNDRILRVEGYVTAIHKLSKTLGMDSTKIITKIHPSLVDVSFGQKSKSISDAILAELNSAVESLEEEKHERLQKIHKLGRALENLWSLMEMNYEDRKSFSHVKDLLSFSADEIFSPGSLAPDIIHQAEAEVERLDQLKASKMKELFFKKQTELMDICKRTHMEMPSQSEIDTIMNLINSGDIGHDDLLKSMDEQILRVKEEASSREPIIEKVEKWIISRDEERWLEEYNRDENRYSVRRGAHKNLKRAERARIIVSKIPALVDQLIENTISWEEERKNVFLYDQVPLLEILEEYNLIRQESEEEKQKQREKKRMQLRVALAQENLFTSSSRLSNGSINGGFGSATPLNRRFSMGVQHQGSKSVHSASKHLSFMMENKKAQEQKIPAQKSLHLRDSRASVMSATYSSPLSP